MEKSKSKTGLSAASKINNGYTFYTRIKYLLFLVAVIVCSLHKKTCLILAVFTGIAEF